jgi:hypothetical protein
MTSFNDHKVDLINNLRCQKGYIIFQFLQFIGHGCTLKTMAQHFTNSVMMINHFQKAVVIPIQVKPQNAHD